MGPPGLMATPRTGVTASPSKNELISAAQLILCNCWRISKVIT